MDPLQLHLIPDRNGFDGEYRKKEIQNKERIMYAVNGQRGHFQQMADAQSERIDNLVINATGDSNPEVIDSRQDSEGNVHSTLKKRLDAEQERMEVIYTSRGINVLFPPPPLMAAKGDGTNDTAAINGCIDYAFQNGGGTVFLPDTDVYYSVDYITMKKFVLLTGNVMEKCVIKQRSGNNKPVLSIIDNNAYGWAIKNITIDGNKTENTGSIDSHGIFIERSQAEESYDMFGLLENIRIRNCSKNGLFLGKDSRETRVKNVVVSDCDYHGIRIGTTDCFFSDVTSYGNKGAGMYFDGAGAMHLSNIKAFGNGKNDSVNKLPNLWFYRCDSILASTVAAQEAWASGVLVDSCENVTISTLLTSSNGITSNNQKEPSADYKYAGLVITRSKRIEIKGLVTDDFRRKIYGSKTQKYGIIIGSGSTDIEISGECANVDVMLEYINNPAENITVKLNNRYIINNKAFPNMQTGNWIPALSNDANDANHNYTKQFGSYTVNGNLATVNFHIGISYLRKGSGGALRISGLPLTPSTTENAMFVGNLIYNGVPLNGKVIVPYIVNNSTRINLAIQDNNFSLLDLNVLTEGQTLSLFGTVTYQIN